MDRYSYDPNSRLARRIKERERRRRKRNRIIALVIIAIVLGAIGFGVFSYVGVGSGIIKQFNPVEGFNRMVTAIRSNDKPASKEPEATPIPTQEPTPTPLAEEKSEEPAFEIVSDDAKGLYPPATENNNFLDIFNNAEGEAEKVCALTFDDGPNKASTLEILDSLKENNVKATFFMTGEQISYNKDIAKAVYDGGHLIANHTYTQNYDMVYKSWDSFYDEVQRTDALIGELTGEEAFKLVRLPGGSHTATKKEYCKKLAEKGYYYIDWSFIAEGNSENIISQVKENTGSKSTVILIEEKNLKNDADKTLKAVIDYLKSEGYTFKRLDEICYYENVDIDAVKEEPVIDAFDLFAMRGDFSNFGRQ